MITDFLKTRRTMADLKVALEVLREFKTCESREENIAIMYAAWAKLDQLEEFLAHLVEGAPLKPDTVAYVKGEYNAYVKKQRTKLSGQKVGGTHHSVRETRSSQ